METNDRSQQQREAFLSLFLTGLGVFFFLVVLILISGGFFLWVLLVALGIGGVALLHYALWGRMLDQEVAGEREEEHLRQRALAEGWPLPDPGARRPGRAGSGPAHY